MRKIKRVGAPILIALSMVVSGCSLIADKSMDETDPPPVSYVDDESEMDNLEGETAGSDEVVQETVLRELYLLDQNGLVAPQAIPVPKTEGPAKQALEYLVEDGPISQLLPSGFQAVLPAGTEIKGVNIKDGVAIVDFSEQFKEYRPENEEKILQSITWTLTQFDSIDSVKIQINGYDQEEMPVNGTPIGEGVSRENGINIESDDVVNLTDTMGVTLYFMADNDNTPYYVPVTRRVDANADAITTVISELIKGPSNFSNLLTDFRTGVKLLDAPHYSNGVVTVNFNEAILNHIDGTAISDEVLHLLVLSLTEQAGVEKVAIQVNGDNNVLLASGEFLSEPVARPLDVNKVKY